MKIDVCFCLHRFFPMDLGCEPIDDDVSDFDNHNFELVIAVLAVSLLLALHFCLVCEDRADLDS